MDPFDTSLFEEPPPDTRDDEKKRTRDPFDDIFGDDIFAPVATATSSRSVPSSGKPTTSSSDLLFSLDDEDDGKAGSHVSKPTSGGPVGARRDLDDLDDLFGPPPVPSESQSRATGDIFTTPSGSATATSLFDDLLDFTSGTASTEPPATTSTTSSGLDSSAAAQNEATASKSLSSTDWLFGGDDVIAATPDPAWEAKPQESTTTQSESEEKNSSEVPVMEEPQEAKTEESDVFDADQSDKSPNVMVTAPSMDQGLLDAEDGVDGRLSDKEGKGKKENDKEDKEKADGEKGKGDDDRDGKAEMKKLTASVSSDASMDSRNSSTSEVDMDFSILELPGTAHLNFETSTHRRTLSKKGSISRRKKPSRAAIHTSKLASNEDSMFVDSTEPRLPKSPLAEEKDDDQEQVAKKREAEPATPEESSSRPTKKVAGGVKIPGLLEGLMGSKRFNKSENKATKQEVATSSKPSPLKTPKPATPSFVPALKPTNKTPETTTSTAAVSSTGAATAATSRPSPPAPAPRPKPAGLHRVLPAIPSKPLRETKNQSKDSVKPSVEEQKPFSVSLKPVPKNTTSPSKPGPTDPLPGIKKDSDSVPAPSLSTPAKDAKPSGSPSKYLSSVGGSDSKKTLSGQPPAKPDVRKKPPTILKKPTVKSTPDKPATPEPLGEVTKPATPEKSLNTQSNENKLKKSPFSPSRIVSNANSAEDKTDGSVKKQQTFSGAKAEAGRSETTKEETVDDGFVVVSKSDVEVKSERDKSDIKTEVSDSILDAKTTSRDLFSDDDYSFLDDAVALSNPKDKSKNSTSISSVPPTTSAPSVPKPNTSRSSDSKQESNTTSETKSTPSSVPRKSSVSGVSSVKPPSSSEKSASSSGTSASPAGNMGRRDSITGSAYNPIGFRSALGSSDSGSESRSRGSSVSSEIKLRGDSVSSTGSDSVKKTSDLSSTGSSKLPPESSSKEKVEERKKPGKPDTKPSWLSEANRNNLNKTKQLDAGDKTKEATDEANKIIKDQGSLRKVSPVSKTCAPAPASKSETTPEDNKSSPWGVRLRKVDSSRPKSIAEPPNNENSSPGVSWRQQMSQKRQSISAPKELDKPNQQQDSTPEWARASQLRRQRLLDSGVINSDAK